MAGSERIYIGGLHPNLLSVEEVLNRLQTDVKDKVELRDISTASTYCHLNAVSLIADHTALETLSKLYNNVKWKGCKIKVQAAVPHFLERLEREREERVKSRNTSIHGEQGPATEREKIDLPRHLKIKRAYGQESWRVDTKPYRVEDWSALSRIKKRLATKQLKCTTKQGLGQSYGHLGNRAFHLKFSNGDDSEPESLVEEVDFSSTSTSNDGDDSTIQSQGGSQPSAVSINEGRASSPLTERKSLTSHKYVWSDSEDDDSLTQEKNPTPVHIGQRPIDDLGASNPFAFDEFAAAINPEDGIQEPSDSSSGFSDTFESRTAHDIESDVERNLIILRGMFPCISEGQHNRRDMTLQGRIDEQNGHTLPSPSKMVRFDPTSVSSHKYLVGQTSVLHGVPLVATHDDIGTSVPDIGNSDTHELINGNVYKQDELEQVFRSSREEPTTLSQNTNGFSFGFQVENTDTTNGMTLFSFDTTKPDRGTLHNGSLDSAALKSDGVLQNIFQLERNRRKGPSFPDEDLDRYVSLFYSLNDCNRIQEGLQVFQHDQKLLDKWQKQREVLTHDWKRKRKHALSLKRR